MQDFVIISRCENLIIKKHNFGILSDLERTLALMIKLKHISNVEGHTGLMKIALSANC